MLFEVAERKKAKLRLGISAPSGGGKTYSALLIAYGITGDWSKIVLIDTERGSGELYADLGKYCIGRLEPPFTPQKYIDAIQSAEKAGFEVVIIDSLSHAWSGEGGMLDMQDTISKTAKSSFSAWREVTPWHNKLVDTILQSKCHMIVTTRSKTEYVLETNEKGKQVPKKVGMAPIFRDGLEYEMTTFFDLSQEHIASVTKDRTNLFDGSYFKPTTETGKKLIEWLNSGAQDKQQTNPKAEPKEEQTPVVQNKPEQKPEQKQEPKATRTAKEILKSIIVNNPEEASVVKDMIDADFGGKKSKELTEEEAAQILNRLQNHVEDDINE